MPSYAMNLRLPDGALIPDHEPVEMADDEAALDEARRAALEIAGDAMRACQRPAIAAIEVEREGGAVGTVRLVDEAADLFSSEE